MAKIVNAVLSMAGIAALMTAISLFLGIRDGFWPVSIGFGVALTYALSMVQHVPNGTLVGISAAAFFVGARYYFERGSATAQTGIVLAVCAAVFLAAQWRIASLRRAR